MKLELDDDSLKQFMLEVNVSDFLLNDREKVSSNYINQGLIIYNIFLDSAIKTEDELLEKWNIEEGGLYLGDEDANIGARIMELQDENYFYARNMEEYLTDEILEGNKNVILEEIDNALDIFKEKYNISEKQIIEMKEDAREIAEKNFEKAVKKIEKLNIRDELEDLCDEWKVAYDKQDYDLMNDLAKDIRKYYTGRYLYRDNDLHEEARVTIVKNEFINNKLKDGKEGIITELEESLIDKYERKGDIIPYLTPKQRENKREYINLVTKGYSMTKEDLIKLEEVKQKFLGDETLPEKIRKCYEYDYEAEMGKFRDELEEIKKNT